MLPDEKFYLRRAIEERMRAARALTEEVRDRHQRLARQFATRAREREVLDAAVSEKKHMRNVHTIR